MTNKAPLYKIAVPDIKQGNTTAMKEILEAEALRIMKDTFKNPSIDNFHLSRGKVLALDAMVALIS